MAIDFDGLVNAVLVDPEIFGETAPVIITPMVSDPGGMPFTIQAIFDRAHDIVLDEVAKSEMRGDGHSTTAPVMTARLAEFPNYPRLKDKVQIGAETFVFYDIQPDGRGMADIVLKAVSG